MSIEEMKSLPLEEIKSAYRRFVVSQVVSPETVKTACSTTFYIWRKCSKELFWDIVISLDFEEKARQILLDLLKEHSTSKEKNNVSGYLSHLRRFRSFLKSEGLLLQEENTNREGIYRNKNKSKRERSSQSSGIIPKPCPKQVEKYLAKWDNLENYRLQEEALNILFHHLCPKNSEITDILLKTSTLNDFYSTNIKSIYRVATHIQSLNIDERLKAGDISLVDDIKSIEINGKIINYYSFATKYCSHHNAVDFPIYDSYVDKVLRYFRDEDNFAKFNNTALKNYICFKKILIIFQNYYNLEKYNLKQIDKYIWQLGKDYFPKKY
jgi:hypothetical protein